MNSFRCKKKSLEAFVALSTLLTTASAFRVANVPTSSNGKTTSFSRPASSKLSALVFGWDGQDEAGSEQPYMDISNEIGQSCSPVGSAVAEALSYDRDRAGHLARLAVAFSPPERALALKNVEKVDVICVHDDSIEIQAVMCQDGGCVSCSVPIKFPKACYSSDPADQLEGCVLRNLDELDSEAGSILMVEEQKAAVEARMDELGDELCELNGLFEAYPDWWIPPECYPQLAPDCESVRQLLNEAEFQPDVNALAQDALRKIADGEDYKALQTKVAIVGPAGICFKVRAESEIAPGRPVHILDVVHPFDQPMSDVESLRAAVLGAVAAAAGN